VQQRRSTRPPVRRLNASQRRHQLLEVAGARFAEHGYHGLSMEQLADAAGVSKPVLYQHFPSKRDLYLALVRDATAAMERKVREALEGTRDNRARVAGAIGAYFDFVEDRRFQLIFGTAELADREVREHVEGVEERVAHGIGALIAEDAGLEPRAASFLASAVRGLATEGARRWVAQPGMRKDEAVQLLAQLAWKGLGSFTPASYVDDATA
jgi:AcrR family transcriptional regulator